eukprot:m.101222 g.101222  ORF g.101222 m.101222 type:complete len:303 (-) comp10380_c0_seq2:180-1088(-)
MYCIARPPVPWCSGSLLATFYTLRLACVWLWLWGQSVHESGSEFGGEVEGQCVCVCFSVVPAHVRLVFERSWTWYMVCSILVLLPFRVAHTPHGAFRFDILVTNPPYSTRPFDHIERLMDFCRKHAGAYLILQPCYVYLKPYYVGSLLRSNGGPAGEFYVTPSLRYTYRTPEGLRDVKAGALSTSPFVTFWYGACGSHRDDLTKWWCEKGKDVCKGCSLRLTARKLPRRYKDSHDDTRPRLRKKQREALKRRQDKALGLNPFRNTKKKKGPRKFNRGDAPHRKRGGPGAPSAAAKSAKRRRF